MTVKTFVVYRPINETSANLHLAVLYSVARALESNGFIVSCSDPYDDRRIDDTTPIQVDDMHYTVGLKLYEDVCRKLDDCAQTYFIISSLEEVDDLMLLMLARSIDKSHVAFVYVKQGVDISGTCLPALVGRGIRVWETNDELLEMFGKIKHYKFSELKEAFSPN